MHIYIRARAITAVERLAMALEIISYALKTENNFFRTNDNLSILVGALTKSKGANNPVIQSEFKKPVEQINGISLQQSSLRDKS